MTATVSQDARALARAAVRQSLPAAQWQANEEFTRTLLAELQQHRFAQHPLIAEMNAGRGSLKWLRNFYLDTVHALSGRFIDYVLQAAVNCNQIEPAVGLRGVAAARCLMQINAVDELGFTPGAIDDNFIADPAKAHVVQLYDVMEQIDLPEAAVQRHQPSTRSQHVAAVLEVNRYDHLRLALVLAVFESTLNPWTECWAVATKAVTRVNTDEGYHAIHVEDDDGHAVDDDHSEDSWYIVRQALTPARHAEVRHLALHLMDTCAAYADEQLQLLSESARTPA
jgi:hypothetical protein